MFRALKSMLWFVYFDMVQIIFKIFEIAQNITKLRIVENSLIFTTNPRMNILNVKLCITKTNVFLLRFIYASELIIRNNTTITLNLRSEFKISIIIVNYLYSFAKSFR